MSITPSLRWKVLSRDNYTCQYCGRRPPQVPLEVDHVIPQSKGGSDEESNLLTACATCNAGKHDRGISTPGTDLHIDINYLVEARGMTRLDAYVEALAVRLCIVDNVLQRCIHAWPSLQTQEEDWPDSYEMLRFVEVYGEQAVVQALQELEKYNQGQQLTTGTFPTIAASMHWVRNVLANGPEAAVRHELARRKKRLP